MGMYDEILVSDKHLPDALKGKEIVFQSKSLNCFLEEYLICENGELYKTNGFQLEELYEKVNYTGEINFYDNLDGTWFEFSAHFVNGELINIISID